MKLCRRNKKGFTLIELIVVIAIIGILGAIVTISVTAVVRDAEIDAAGKKLTTLWSRSNLATDMINKGLATVAAPDETFYKTYISEKFTLSKDPCAEASDISDSVPVYIQYAENKSSSIKPFSIKKIWINYKGRVYYTEDGTSVDRAANLES